ncbi:hypothetical protein ACHAXS_004069 [Conticribra weissflogii]
MWGRITQIAERIDGTFAPDNDDDNDDNDDDVDNDDTMMDGENNDGWGDDDDLDDESAFDDNDGGGGVDGDGLDFGEEGGAAAGGDGDDAWGEDDVAALEEDLRELDYDVDKDDEDDDLAVAVTSAENRGFVSAAALLSPADDKVADVDDAIADGFGFDDGNLDDLDCLDDKEGVAVGVIGEDKEQEHDKVMIKGETKTANEDVINAHAIGNGNGDERPMESARESEPEQISAPLLSKQEMTGESLEEQIVDGQVKAEAEGVGARVHFDDVKGNEEPVRTQLDNNTVIQQRLRQPSDGTSSFQGTKPDSQLVPEPVTSTMILPTSIVEQVTAAAVPRAIDEPSAIATETAYAVTETPATPTPFTETEPTAKPNHLHHTGAITVSAPGKALIAGGYLVLEQPNPGVVLAAKGCRFHSTIMLRPVLEETDMDDGGSRGIGNANVSDNDSAVDATAPWKSIPVDVHSPQFHRIYRYTLWYSSLDYSPQRSTEGTVASPLATLRLQPRHAEASSSSSETKNAFLEKTLLLALGYLHQSLGGREFHERIRRMALEALGKEPTSSSSGPSQQETQSQSRSQQQQPPQPQPSQSQTSSSMALAIKLRADNDFYSQIHHLRQRGWDLTPQNMELLEPFLPCPKEADSGHVVVHKTGLGSSAALVTSLVGALLTFFGVISLPEVMDGEDVLAENGDSQEGAATVNGMGNSGKYEEGLRIAHNLSQICHCYAQGKVGSGFDVSSAVYGSHIYTRFSRRLIGKFLDGLDKEGSSSSLTESVSRQLVDVVDDANGSWDSTVTPVNLPPGLELLMADVCGGSESPSMAKQILEWKKNNRKTGFLDDYYWKDLKRCNKKIGALLTDQFASAPIRDGLRRDGAMILANRTAEQWKKPMPSSWHEFVGSSWDVAGKLIDLRMAILESRQNLKGMGKAAGVPVEPDEQTALANATMKLPGVVAAGVPGAGGYDALYVIYVKGPDTCDGKSDRVRDEIGKFWNEWNRKEEDGGSGNTKAVVCPLSVRAAGFGGENGLCASKIEW